MKPRFRDLTMEQQISFGDGCGSRKIKVPAFVFSASCRHHDFNFERGCGANEWYENIWKAPYYYTKANCDFYIKMILDSYKWWHYVVATIYFVSVMFVSWPWFTAGKWKTMQEILDKDSKKKMI